MLLQSPSLEANGGFASEVKFLVNRPIAAEIRAWARENLIADPHGAGPSSDTYHITSLYLDTPSFDVLRKIGSHGRSKYRVRRYGASDHVFLERKMKREGRVRKRRTETPAVQIVSLASGIPSLLWSGYWFHRRLVARQLQPVCQISYSRTARFAPTPGGAIRLTLDDNITALGACRR